MAWEIIFPQTEEPKRIENFLKKRFPIGYVRKLFRKKAVRLNGRRSSPEELARPGDRVQLFIPFEKQARKGEKEAPRITPNILFEDGNFLVINKQAGISVHEGKEILKAKTLLGMLEAAYRLRGVIPRLVHRIDKETSGLLVVAKRDDVAKELERRFEEGEVNKEYLALVVGRLYPKEGSITFPLPGRDGKLVKALTFYKVEREFAGTTLSRV
ncbi:MAG: pseudouridine synthase, partial [Candidatus Binatia bacterium]